MTKKTKYILKNTLIACLVAGAVSVPGLILSFSLMYFILVIVCVTCITVLATRATLVILEENKKIRIFNILADLSEFEKSEFWIKYDEMREKLLEEFPNIDAVTSVCERAITDKKEIEDLLKYFKTEWQTKELMPSFFDDDYNSWRAEPERWRKKVSYSEEYYPDHVMFLRCLQSDKNEFLKLKNGVRFDQFEELESTPYKSQINSVVQMWKKEFDDLCVEFEMARYRWQVENAVQRMKKVKENVEELVNLVKILNSNDVVEEPTKETTMDGILIWMLKSRCTEHQEKAAV